LLGHSLTLSELNTELQAHGHTVQHLTDLVALQLQRATQASIPIEDGSLVLGGDDLKGFGLPALLSLRVGLNSTAGSLPRLELLCWHGSARAQRLI
ncbi:hypothetical protein, partial [Pseudomonas viridiflava]|uniref:hypothetical protein n=1 Tax=Pseudomonas viridiflava TaxID=33069 RepID=UPI0013DFE3CE